MRWAAVKKLRFVERLASTSFSEAQLARRRYLGQPDHTLCDLPSNAASVSNYRSRRFLLAVTVPRAPTQLFLLHNGVVQIPRLEVHMKTEVSTVTTKGQLVIHYFLSSFDASIHREGTQVAFVEQENPGAAAPNTGVYPQPPRLP
jgi:hypothetical protein